MGQMTAVISTVLIISSIVFGVNSSSPYAADSEESEGVFSAYDFSSGEDAAAEEANLPEDAQILVDNEDLLIAATDWDPEDLWGCTLDVYLKNKTDRKLGFLINNACINGLMMDPFYQTALEPGEAVNGEVEWFQSDFDEADIKDVTDIELEWVVYDYDDWAADFLLEEKFHIYPYGEDAAVPYVRKARDTDRVLVDNEECTIIATGSEKDELWGFRLHLYIINKSSSHSITVAIDDAYINGESCFPYWATMIYPDRAACEAITWSNSLLEESGIETVKSLELPIVIMDSEDFSKKPVSETVTYEP